MKFRSLRFLILLPSICFASEAGRVDAPVEIIASVQGVEKQRELFPPEIDVWMKIQSPASLKGIVFVLNTGLENSAVVDANFPKGGTFRLLVPELLTAGIWKVKKYSDEMARPGVKIIATDLAALPYIDLARLSVPLKHVSTLK